ncbi:hypothetical protein L6452_02123 [Arctium lappa]|uniref:Uncharacterized protein n=1 Tax=Arctium lappa TaxID=4217 RepID=A0ACB9FJD2_ARCLA|nr:hypothetical protein L6452_02123 [Arctium lappa]
MDIKWQMTMLSMRVKKFIKRTGRNNFSQRREDVAGFDKSKVECYKCHLKGHFARECRSGVSHNNNHQQAQSGNLNHNRNSAQALVSQQGMGFDWSDQAEEAIQNQALMAEVSDLPTEVSSNLCFKTCIDTVKRYRDHNQKMSDDLKRLEKDIKDYVRIVERFEEQIKGFQANELQHSYDTNYWKWEKRDLELKLTKSKEESEKLREELTKVKLDVEKFSNASKAMDSLLQTQIHDKLRRGIGYNATPSPYNNNYIPPTSDLLETKDRKDLTEGATEIDPLDEVVVEDKTEKEVGKSKENNVSGEIPLENNIITNEDCGKTWIKSKDIENQRESLVSTKTVSTATTNSAADNVSAARSNTTAINVSIADIVSTSSNVNTTNSVSATNKVSTAKPVSTSNSVSSTSRGNQQLKGKSIWHVDSGCSRHMTGNMSCLKNFKKIDGGHVAFGNTPDGGSGSGGSGDDQVQVQDIIPQSVIFPIPTIEPVDVFAKESMTEPTQNEEEGRDEENQVHEEPEAADEIPSADLNDSNLYVGINEEPSHQTRTQKNHPPELVIGDISSPMITRNQSRLQELQNQQHKVWDLVDLPKGHRAIGTKWIFRNKKDERGIVIRNKARLVAQGYTQEEGINYEEVFALVARVEAIRLFLAYASYMKFKVYVMDVKSAFLYGTIDEEVYVCQPPGFENPSYPNRVYKLKKALYGLHQAPRAWYDTLYTYLLENGFERGIIDKTLFIKRSKKDILLVQIYVDDIIFGSIKDQMCRDFEMLMHKSFKMSSMGELTFFLRLQVKQKKDGIFISQSKYVKDILDKYGLPDSKPASTHMETHKQITANLEGEDVDVHLYRSMIGSLMYLTASRPDIMFTVCLCDRFQVKPKQAHLQVVKRIFRYLRGQPRLGLWYPYESNFDLIAYSDSDLGGANMDRKSTSGGCQLLGARLVSWQCKKQTTVSLSTTKDEYIAVASCYSQVLRIQNQMLDYGITFLHTPIFIDNSSAISNVNNLVKHSKIKHIEIRYHFIRDCNEKKLIQVAKVHTDNQFADLFTKAFDVGRFTFLVTRELITLLRVPKASKSANATIVTENGVQVIKTRVCDKPLSVSEKVIRICIRLDDAAGITSIPNEDLFSNLSRMRYGGQLGGFKFLKAKFYTQWRLLVHTMMHCISKKTTGWSEFSSTIAYPLVCLATSRKYNFSRMIFSDLVSNLGSKKSFYMYPSFVQEVITHELTDMPHFDEVYVPKIPKGKVFSNMNRSPLDSEGVDTPLFSTMMVVSHIEEGMASGKKVKKAPSLLVPIPTEPLSPLMENSPLENIYRETKGVSPNPKEVLNEEMNEHMGAKAATTPASTEEVSGNINKTFPMETLAETSSIAVVKEQAAETVNAAESSKAAEMVNTAELNEATEIVQEVLTDLEIAETFIKAKHDTPKVTSKTKELSSKKELVESDEALARKMQDDLEQEERVQVEKDREMAKALAAELNEAYQQSLATEIAQKKAATMKKSVLVKRAAKKRQPSKTYLGTQERNKMITFLKGVVGVRIEMFSKMLRIKELYDSEMLKLQGNETAIVEMEKRMKESNDFMIEKLFPDEQETPKKEATLGESLRTLKRTKIMARRKTAKKPRVAEEEAEKVAEEEGAPKSSEQKEPSRTGDVNLYMVVMDKVPEPITSEPVGVKPLWDTLKVDGKEYTRLKRKDEKYEVFNTWAKIVRTCSRSDLEEIFEIGMKLYADQLKAPEISITKLTLYETSGVYALTMDINHIEYFPVDRVYNHSRLKQHAMLKKKLGCVPDSEMAKYLIQRTINQSLGLDANKDPDTHHPQKVNKIVKPKVHSKSSINQSSSSGTKITNISQRSTPKLKIDIKHKKSEELKVPPRSKAKGILAVGLAHVKFSNSTTSSLKATLVYRKGYHYGLTDHIASKCPTATKADKIVKVKMNAAKAEKVTTVEKSSKVKNATKVKKLTKVKVTSDAESSDAVKTVEPSISTNPTRSIKKWALAYSAMGRLPSKESPCEKGKKTKASFKSKQVSSVASPLQLLHMDLFCFILKNKDTLGKFDPKVDDGIFLGYSSISKAYRVFNKRRQTIEEIIHVTFEESRSVNSKPIVRAYLLDTRS